MDRRDRREIDSYARFGASRIMVWTVVGVLFFGALGAGIWYFRVATAPVKGWGDEQIIVNDGRNRVNAQEWFAGKYGFVKGQDAKIPGMQANLEATKGTADEALWRSSLTGLQNLCLQAVAEYNAESEKISRGRWKSPNLPFSLPDGEATDCK